MLSYFTFTILNPRFDGAPPVAPEPTPEKKEEVKPGEPSATDDYNIKRDRNKSFRQLAKERQDRIQKQKEEDKKKEETPETSGVETPPAEKVEAGQPAPTEKKEETVVTPQPNAEEQAKKEREEAEKRQEELATRAAKEASEQVAKEVKDAFKSEIDKILQKDKSITEQQEEADKLIATWEKEGRLPKDYKEVVQEVLRINEERMNQRLQEIENKQKEEQTQKQEQEKKQQEDLQKAEDEKLQAFQKQITDDLEEIYTAKFLPRPKDINEINNPNTADEAAKETQKLFEFGVKLNTERRAKGLPAVTSLNKIYFLHYKPVLDAAKSQPNAPKQDEKQPAGANAPVGGVGNQSQTTTPEKAYVYARDHKKSFDQLKAEALARFRKAMKLS